MPSCIDALALELTNLCLAGLMNQMVAANSEEVFARQIRYIQVQLGSSAPDHAGPPSGDEEEFEDVDEEGEELGDEEVEDWEPEEALNQVGRTGRNFGVAAGGAAGMSSRLVLLNRRPRYSTRVSSTRTCISRYHVAICTRLCTPELIFRIQS